MVYKTGTTGPVCTGDSFEPPDHSSGAPMEFGGRMHRGKLDRWDRQFCHAVNTQGQGRDPACVESQRAGRPARSDMTRGGVCEAEYAQRQRGTLPGLYVCLQVPVRVTRGLPWSWRKDIVGQVWRVEDIPWILDLRPPKAVFVVCPPDF
ncbi:uncharacterized protein LOC111946477 [Oryzias latipes]